MILVLNRMIPAPFVSDDYLRARLALPFGKPLIAGRPFNKPFDRSISFGELPMVKAYAWGGLITTDEDKREWLEKEKNKVSPFERARQWGNAPENRDFIRSVLDLF